MNDERERQQRDLERATLLLETMSRDEMFEMLLDILLNERSDDTRKLSDWMAFQIIIQDETRAARKLLTGLGKDGKNHRKAETDKVPLADGDNLAISSHKCEEQDGSMDEDSNSSASFATCPDLEDLEPNPAPKPAVVGILQSTVNTDDKRTLPEAHDLSGPSSKTRKMQVGAVVNHQENSSAEAKGLDIGSTNRPSWFQGLKAISNGSPRSSSDSNTTKLKNPHLHESLSSSNPAILNAASHQDTPSPAARPQASGKFSKASVKIKALKTTNQLFHQNLEEFFSRFERVASERPDEWQADAMKSDACDTHIRDLSPLAVNQPFEDKKKMQCQFCNLYFEDRENLRDLDNGSPPCSYHPGEPVYFV
ncbi:hypothetical protein N8I77_006718 [Diaporthe amygdali]|uniref:Uncharacterized protein n=1 Tax=Phomopsis amygdali TaxID=1214568 RepID=A0AAD9SGE6_PHOAM|nr:hypothetical protein N8I77_006718 [Diaporthe amygdali]